jgi:hypothetical protein
MSNRKGIDERIWLADLLDRVASGFVMAEDASQQWKQSDLEPVDIDEDPALGEVHDAVYAALLATAIEQESGAQGPVTGEPERLLRNASERLRASFAGRHDSRRRKAWRPPFTSSWVFVTLGVGFAALFAFDYYARHHWPLNDDQTTLFLVAVLAGVALVGVVASIRYGSR